MESFIAWRKTAKDKCTLEELYDWFARVPKPLECGKRKRYDFECDIKGCPFVIEQMSSQQDLTDAMIHLHNPLAHILQLLYDDSYCDNPLRDQVRRFVFEGFAFKKRRKYFDALVSSILATSEPKYETLDKDAELTTTEVLSSSESDEESQSYSSSDSDDEEDASLYFEAILAIQHSTPAQKQPPECPTFTLPVCVPEKRSKTLNATFLQLGLPPVTLNELFPQLDDDYVF